MSAKVPFCKEYNGSLVPKFLKGESKSVIPDTFIESILVSKT